MVIWKQTASFHQQSLPNVVPGMKKPCCIMCSNKVSSKDNKIVMQKYQNLRKVLIKITPAMEWPSISSDFSQHSLPANTCKINPLLLYYIIYYCVASSRWTVRWRVSVSGWAAVRLRWSSCLAALRTAPRRSWAPVSSPRCRRCPATPPPYPHRHRRHCRCRR